MRRFLPFVISLLLPLISAAQNANYNSLNGPPGGNVVDIAADASGNLLATIGGTGIYRSTNAGSTWTLSNTGITDPYVRDLEVDPVSGKVYALTYSNLFTSVDGGVTWVQTASVGFNAGFRVKKTTQYLFIIGQDGNIYRSGNDGTTWGQAGTYAGNVTDVQSNSSGTLFIGTSGNGVYSTSDGITVTPVNGSGGTKLSDLFVNSLAVSGSNLFAMSSSSPFISTDNGTTWNSAKGNNADGSYSGLITADPSGGVYIFNSNSLTLKKTINNGSTWTTVTYPTPAGEYFIVSAAYFTSATVFYASFNNLGIEKTTNGGTTWALASSGMTGFYPGDFVISNTGKLLYARSATGLHVSIDDGVSWNLLATASTNRTILGFNVQGTTVYAYGSGLINSTNGGSTWNVVNVSTYLGSLLSADGTHFFSCDGTNLMKSADGGATWTTQTVSGFPATYYLMNSKIDASGNVYWLVQDNSAFVSKLYKVNTSTGVGTQITNLPSAGGGISDIDYFNGKLYVLQQNSQLAITSNAGTSWTSKTTQAGYGTLKVISDQTLFVLNNNSYISTDGGNSWVNQGTFGLNRNIKTAAISTANFAYLALEYGPVFKSIKAVVPPVAPSALVSTGVANSIIDLAFTDNSNNEDYFILEQSLDNITFDSVGTITRDDSSPQTRVDYSANVNGGTLYYFRVRAASSTAGKSAYSNTFSTTSLSNACSPSTPAIPDNHSWTANSGAGPVLHILIQAAGGNQYNVTTLNAGACSSAHGGTDYPGTFLESCGKTLVIGSVDVSNGNGTWNSATNTVTLNWQTADFFTACSGTTTFVKDANDPAPGDVSAMNAYPISSTNVLLRWVTSQFEQQYIVYRSTTDSAHFTELTRLAYPNTVYNDYTVTGGTTYYYKVRAANGTPDGQGHYPVLSGGYSPGAKVTLLTNPLFEPIINAPFVSYIGTTGGSWGDVDGDGFDDLVLPTSSDSLGTHNIPPLLFRGHGDGQFSKAPLVGIDSAAYRNVNIIDVDNDGRNDIFLRKADNTDDFLYLQQADGSYHKVTIPSGGGSRAMSAWADYDNDGLLDLFVTTDDGGLTPSRLFRNNGDKTFTKITSGDLVNDLISNSLDAQWADYDNDGDQDMFRPAIGGSKLYQNNGNGTFTRVVGSAFDAFTNAQRTASWGDYDNDGDLDLFVGSTGAANTSGLFRNNGNGTFTQITTSADINSLSGVYGSGWGDIDNDGDLDLLVTSSIQSQVLYNTNGIFTKYSTIELFNSPALGKLYGVPFYDVDRDGFLDFYNGGFSAVGVPNIVYRNKTPHTSSTNWVQVRLTGTISNRSAIGARVKLTAGGKTQIREVQSHTSYGAEGSLIVHFGIGSATTITSIVIDWPSSSPNQTLLNPPINQIISITEDLTGPVATTLSPANGANNVLVTTTLSVTLSEPSTAVAGKNLNVFKTSDLVNPVATVLVSSASVTGNVFTFTLPQSLAPVTTYAVAVDAGAFQDIYGNPSLAFAPGVWQFTTVDNVPPVIVFSTPPSSMNKGSVSSAQFVATATDNSDSVASVTLRHRPISGGAFVDLAGTFNKATNKWNFAVTESMPDGMGLEYYFTAKDLSKNKGSLPLDTTANHFYTYLNYPTAQSIIPPSVLGLGGLAGNWRIFTIPFDLGSGNGISAVLDELKSLTVKTDWRMLTYQNTTAWAEYPGDFAVFTRGIGYFINIRQDPGTITIGDEVAPSNNRQTLFPLSLKKGWNEIGNPYLTPISWSDVATLNSLTGTDAQLKTFSSGGYVAATTLQPFEGGFVFVQNDVTVNVPFSGQTAVGGRQSDVVSADLGQDQWQVNLHLQQNGLVNDLSGIGMRPDARLSIDAFDDVNPPPFINYLEMNFPHPEFFAKNFSVDVVPTQEAYQWEFRINSNQPGLAELSWNNDEFGASSRRLYLFDVSLQKPIDMRAVSKYSFEPKEASTFRIYFGENLAETLKPDRILLGKAYPNPTAGTTIIPFTLPDQATPFRVTLEVFDIMGTRVSTLAQGDFNPGFFQSSWNPGMLNLSDGLYIYRLVVGDGDKSVVQSGKIILRK